MKKRVGMLIVLLFIPNLYGDFYWFNDTYNRITYDTGGTNYLLGDLDDSSIACFVQLVHAGADNQIDPAIASGDGTSGDDSVCMTAWMGYLRFPSPYNGVVGYVRFTNDIEFAYYYVRAWAAPAQDYSNGIVPLYPTNRYGDSFLWQYLTGEVPQIDFDFGGSTGFSTTVKPLVVDSDTNGLPDWWEYSHFKVFTNTDPWADADTDTVANIHEYYAGTDPTNAWSFLAIDGIGMNGASGRVLRWPAESRQLYALERGTNDFAAGNRAFSFALVTNRLQSVDGWLSFTDRVEGAGPYFYRVTTTVFTNW